MSHIGPFDTLYTSFEAQHQISPALYVNPFPISASFSAGCPPSAPPAPPAPGPAAAPQ